MAQARGTIAVIFAGIFVLVSFARISQCGQLAVLSPGPPAASASIELPPKGATGEEGVRSGERSSNSETPQQLVLPAVGQAVGQEAVLTAQLELRKKNRAEKEKLQKPLFFLHFHKAGGTAACWMTQECYRAQPWLPQNRRKDVSFLFDGNLNCNLPGDGPYKPPYGVESGKLRDHAMWISAFPYTANCSTRKAYVKQKGLRFLARERWLDDFCPEDFAYVTIMRHPLSRILSHLRVHHVQEKQANGWLDNPPTVKYENAANGKSRKEFTPNILRLSGDFRY